MEPVDIRLRQLSRIYDTELDLSAAQSAVADAPDVFAAAIFDEAAKSDDVTGADDAARYLESRFDFFAGLVPIVAHPAIRREFTARWQTWERV